MSIDEENKNQSQQKMYTHCKRCGKKLKSMESMQKGYGVVCEKKLRYVNNRKLFQVCIREHVDWRGNPV